MPADIFDRDDLPFPSSLPEFQRLFPNDAACAAYLEAIRWQHGFTCMWCGERGEPFRISTRPHVLRCRKCRKDNALRRPMTASIRAVGITLTVVVMGENRISMDDSMLEGD